MIGRNPVRVLLYPIALYYVTFLRYSRNAIIDYLSRVYGRKPSFREVFRLYYTFASTIHDRIYFLQKKYKYYDITLKRDRRMYDNVAEGKGVVLIGSHHGSFEILRTLGSYLSKLPVNILMYKNEGQNIIKALRTISPDYDLRILEIGNPGDIMKAKECLEKGELIGVLGDRILKDGSGVECDFLGGKAMFPDGPFRLAELLNAPTFFFSGVFLGKNKYHISIELISESLSREERRATDRQFRIEKNVRKMASLLEEKCRKYPDNWFNFYRYWLE